ncbi:hypothetical protein [Pseudomonas syringae]|uniref:hypothetical protein n=1 Tax=Pseudomonas syringae TaxID=317 RepID=UPI0002098DF0|nr:hypothetical protein [Pseudomonas syringae]MDP5168580.1 hypothetical protein [Pseudomonas syringae pv. aptata str. DSM 50252]
MDDQVTPLLTPVLAACVGGITISLGIVITLRYGYRYYMFRKIDSEGFDDPDLQALHLQMQKEEVDSLLTRTSQQLVISIVSAIATVAFIYFAPPSFVGVLGHG